jgi:hypothetical protein
VPPAAGPSPWSARQWALPVLSVPTRSPALSRKLGKRHRTTPEYAEILIALVRRWQPDRDLVLVGDSAFATAGLALTCRHLAVRFVSRLLLTAQRYDPVPPQPARQAGRQAEEGTAAAQALGAAH